MENNYLILVTGGLLTLLGSLAGGVVQHFLSLNADKTRSQNKLREVRYKNILLHMIVLLDEKNLKIINQTYPGEDKQFEQTDHKDFLASELKQAQIYAPQSVLTTFNVFLDDPIEKNFDLVSLAMRKDLGNGKISIV